MKKELEAISRKTTRQNKPGNKAEEVLEEDSRKHLEKLTGFRKWSNKDVLNVKRANMPVELQWKTPREIKEEKKVHFGCVLTAGRGQIQARKYLQR